MSSLFMLLAMLVPVVVLSVCEDKASAFLLSLVVLFFLDLILRNWLGKSRTVRKAIWGTYNEIRKRHET